MHLTYNAINSQYAVKQSLPLGGDLEGFYAFNAKELDEENGMYYYSARYYAPPTFISRDPLMDEKPWLSPYHYCSNNPVKRIDPNGEQDYEQDNEIDIKINVDEDTKYYNRKGELLYETNDDLRDVIVVYDQNIPKLENKLNELNQTGELNNPEMNEKELHKLGIDI